MRFKVVTLLATAVAFGAAQSALAADMPVKAPMAPAVARYNWTGFYIGGNVGYGWGNGSTTLGFSDPGAVAGTAAAIAGGAIPVNLSPDPKGVLGGLQIGYNFQVAPSWIVGVETDFAVADITGSQTINTAAPGFFALTESASQRLDTFGTIRARFGYAANNWLFYGTGGGAYGHVKNSFTQSNIAGGGPVNTAGSDSKTLFGWTAGGGVEYGWARWSAKFEYLYYNLGHDSFTIPVNVAAPAATFTPNFVNRGSIVRIGLNYHF